jgi:hypothetical protein
MEKNKHWNFNISKGLREFSKEEIHVKANKEKIFNFTVITEAHIKVTIYWYSFSTVILSNIKKIVNEVVRKQKPPTPWRQST